MQLANKIRQRCDRDIWEVFSDKGTPGIVPGRGRTALVRALSDSWREMPIADDDAGTHPGRLDWYAQLVLPIGVLREGLRR